MVHCGVLEVGGVIGECGLAAKAKAKELIRGEGLIDQVLST